jgi:hypothetical protein
MRPSDAQGILMPSNSPVAVSSQQLSGYSTNTLEYFTSPVMPEMKLASLEPRPSLVANPCITRPIVCYLYYENYKFKMFKYIGYLNLLNMLRLCSQVWIPNPISTHGK